MAEFRLMLGVGLQLPSVATRSRRWTVPTVPTITFDVDAQAYFVAVTSNGGAELATATKLAINDFVVSAKSGSNPWAQITRLVVMGNEHSVAARTDLRAPAKSWIASGAPAFEPLKGYQGDRTAAYISAGEQLTVAPATISSSSMFCWVNGLGTGTAVYQMGIVGATTSRLQTSANATIASIYSMNDANTAGTLGTTTRLGFRCGSRTSTTERSFYADPTTVDPLGTVAVAASGTNPASVCLLRSTNTYGGDRQWMAGYGAGLSGAQVLQLYNNLETLRAALGVPKS
jgi:hypothetical protein